MDSTIKQEQILNLIASGVIREVISYVDEQVRKEDAAAKENESLDLTAFSFENYARALAYNVIGLALSDLGMDVCKNGLQKTLDQFQEKNYARKL